MNATRRRFGSLVEWGVAASFAVLAVMLLAVALNHVRRVPAVVPVSATEVPLPAPSGAIPAGVVPVPLLSLGEGSELRLGQRLSDVAERLAGSRLLSESLDTSSGKARLTRFYQDVGLQFIVVFDGTPDDPSAPLAAIFIR